MLEAPPTVVEAKMKDADPRLLLAAYAQPEAVQVPPLPHAPVAAASELSSFAPPMDLAGTMRVSDVLGNAACAATGRASARATPTARPMRTFMSVDGTPARIRSHP